jgi:large subunit ribosomal protein L29
MKAKELRERTDEALLELEKQLEKQAFDGRFKNYTNRLNDTASIRRAKKDLARVKTVLTQRAGAAVEEGKG